MPPRRSTIVAAVAAVLLIAVVAGAFGFRATVADALRSRAGLTPRTTRRATRAALVGLQVAVTVMLVAGAGLFARSLVAALNLNSEMDMPRLVMGLIQLQPYGYTAERAQPFFDDLIVTLNNNPAIQAASFSNYEGGMSSVGKLHVNGAPRQFPSTVSHIRVDPEYFRTIGIRQLDGRGFKPDDKQQSPPVAVVGVVADVVGNVTILESLVIYLPLAQGKPRVYRDLAIRAAPTSTVADVRREALAAIKALDPQVAPTPLRTLEERVLAQMLPQQLGATVLGALGAIAVLLTLLGAYVIADSMATMRMREMGIRAALGATRRQLGAIVLAETARLVGAGVMAGLALAWLSANTIRAFLFQVQPLDPITLAGVSVLILALALAVSVRAAIRSARVDLSTVLKAE